MTRSDIVVAGHMCIDILPAFESRQPIDPGKLIKIGPARFASGGAVANTGVALHRLGAAVQLVSRIGNDAFGRELLATLDREGKGLSRGIRVLPDAVTSYSIVISPPGVDRSFLHCSGENDRFDKADLKGIDWKRASLFHLGYPPIMRKMYENEGHELAAVLREARSHGVITSLDMCMPDAKSESGKADWARICERALPFVDLFCPSVEELIYMLDRPLYRKWAAGKVDLSREVGGELLARLSGECLSMGARVVLIKLGDQGLYLRTSADTVFAHQSLQWANRELHCRCRRVNVVGTTGSGDCTIAGFLLAVSRGLSPEVAMTHSTAVGATCCEAADATSAIVKWPSIEKRIRAGWPWLETRIKLKGWKPLGELRAGPNDRTAAVKAI